MHAIDLHRIPEIPLHFREGLPPNEQALGCWHSADWQLRIRGKLRFPNLRFVVDGNGTPFNVKCPSGVYTAH